MKKEIDKYTFKICEAVKLGYSYGDAADEMSWRESVSDAFIILRDKK